MSDESAGINIIPGFQDVFGAPTTNVSTNVVDIPSHYPINPERWRIFVNGTRQFPQYSSVAQYNHAGPHHELIPNQGDTVILETSERPRYSVGFEQLYSMAVGLSRSLESGDQLRVGPFDDNDGWFLEHNPSHADDQVDLVTREGGSDTAVFDQPLAKAITTLTRFELHTAWYRVTRQLWRQSYADDNSHQQNEKVGRVSSSDGGPEVGNLPLRFEVTRGASSSALTVKAGSCALLTKGSKTTIRRNKTHEVSVTTDSTAGDAGNESTFFPQYAFRVDPNRSIVNLQLTNVKIMKYGGTGDVRVAFQAHDKTKVHESDGTELDDADFATPPTHSAQNSVFEDTTAVTDAPNSAGTISASADDLGGYQIGYGSLYSTGTGSASERTQGTALQKRAVYGGDIAVMWVHADDSGANLVVEITTEQDW